ncbi:MAG TPA: nucleolar RNA-binding Nop10p family protein [Candidatus Poseidoniales archaeon]|nr:nucleolar RNA-binding Nop10p family protein [Candidatus Poseidoniales archaeon]
MRRLIQRCNTCKAYGLGEVCPLCGGTMKQAAPLKFSPQDRHQAIRLRLREESNPNWLDELPTLDDGDSS